MNEPSPISPPLESDVKVLPAYLVVADLIHIAAAVGVLSYLLFLDVPVQAPIKLILIGLATFVVIRGWTWAILSAILANILMREPRGASDILGWDAIIYCVLCLALVAYSAGFRALRPQLRNWLGLLLQEMLRPKATPVSDGNTEPTSSGDPTKRMKLLRQATISHGRVIAGLVLCVIVAMIAFVQLPLSRFGIDLWWERSLATHSMLWPGPVTFLMIIGGFIVLSVGGWRALSSSQAGMYLRTMRMTYYFRDIRSIEYRLSKLRSKVKR